MKALDILAIIAGGLFGVIMLILAMIAYGVVLSIPVVIGIAIARMFF